MEEGKKKHYNSVGIIHSFLLHSDEVPPLEDMTEYLQTLKEKKQDVRSVEKPKTSRTDSSLLGLENRDSTFPVTSKKLLIVNQDPEITDVGFGEVSNGSGIHEIDSCFKSTEPKAGTTSFGGMKKGFLFGGPSASRKKPSADRICKKKGPEPLGKKVPEQEEIPLIKPVQNSRDNPSKLKIEEVQTEMKKAYPLLTTKGNG